MEEVTTEMKLSERMKWYEGLTSSKLETKTPVIIRLDGKSFRNFTRGMEKPFDIDLSKVMEYVCDKLKTTDNVRFIYTQSDEISLLLTDWTKENTQSWFQYRIQKIVSTSAALATLYFNEYIEELTSKYYRLYNQKDLDEQLEKLYLEKYKFWKSKKYKASFDSRAFNLPMDEVCNYFIFRQNDAERNSKQSLAQAYFSQKELLNVGCPEMINMVKTKTGIIYDELPLRQQRGFALYKDENEEWYLDENIPKFVEDREFIDKWLK